MMDEGDNNNISLANDDVMSTEQIRQQAGDWSLAGDAGLRKHLEAFANRLEVKSVELQSSLSRLERRIDATNTSIGM